jgi:RNA polymerase sigma factor (sigma-70 family)
MVERIGRIKQLDDAALVEEVLAGEPGAFDELFERYSHRVYAFALRRVGRPADAEDIAQEVFLQLHRSLPSYQRRASLATWIFGITHNVTCRHYRRRSAPVVSMDQDDSPELVGEIPTEERRIDAARVVERCTDALARSRAPEHLEIFRLFYGVGSPLRVIARATGKPADSVKDSLRRSRNLLRRDVPDVRAALAAAAAGH